MSTDFAIIDYQDFVGVAGRWGTVKRFDQFPGLIRVGIDVTVFDKISPLLLFCFLDHAADLVALIDPFGSLVIDIPSEGVAFFDRRPYFR
jgi:hypothetical protein